MQLQKALGEVQDASSASNEFAAFAGTRPNQRWHFTIGWLRGTTPLSPVQPIVRYLVPGTQPRMIPKRGHSLDQTDVVFTCIHPVTGCLRHVGTRTRCCAPLRHISRAVGSPQETSREHSKRSTRKAPSSDGLQPSSDDLQPNKSDGLQPGNDLVHRQHQKANDV